jgi:hypothetical protein
MNISPSKGTSSPFAGAVLLLSELPSPERQAEIARLVADEHFPDAPFIYSIRHTLPENLSEDNRVKLVYEKSQLSGSAVYLVVSPSEALHFAGQVVV